MLLFSCFDSPSPSSNYHPALFDTLTSTIHELPDVGGGHQVVGSQVVCQLASDRHDDCHHQMGQSWHHAHLKEERGGERECLWEKDTQIVVLIIQVLEMGEWRLKFFMIIAHNDLDNIKSVPLNWTEKMWSEFWHNIKEKRWAVRRVNVNKLRCCGGMGVLNSDHISSLPVSPYILRYLYPVIKNKAKYPQRYQRLVMLSPRLLLWVLFSNKT